ncbi:MAG: hypothetical protein WDN28_21080 [Chthoniobacter sp.]
MAAAVSGLDDAASLNSILGYGVNAVVYSNLTATDKTAALIDADNGLVPILLKAHATGDQFLVTTIVRNSLTSAATGLVPANGTNAYNTPAGQILGAAVNALYAAPTPRRRKTRPTNITSSRWPMGALASNQGGSLANTNALAALSEIRLRRLGPGHPFNKVASLSLGGVPYYNYTDAAVGGYQNATAALFGGYVSGASVKAYAAAAASGAVTKAPGSYLHVCARGAAREWSHRGNKRLYQRRAVRVGPRQSDIRECGHQRRHQSQRWQPCRLRSGG